MWSFKRAARNVMMISAIAASLAAVSGCSFAPVYGEGSVSEQTLELNYAKPTTRLEQVVYQELKLRLGSGADASAPLVTVVVRTAARALTRSSVVGAPAAAEITAIGTVTVVQGETTIASFVRRATASYTTGPQVLANTSAVAEAGERAATALSESIRLSLIGLLAGY